MSTPVIDWVTLEADGETWKIPTLSTGVSGASEHIYLIDDNDLLNVGELKEESYPRTYSPGRVLNPYATVDGKDIRLSFFIRDLGANPMNMTNTKATFNSFQAFIFNNLIFDLNTSWGPYGPYRAQYTGATIDRKDSCFVWTVSFSLNKGR